MVGFRVVFTGLMAWSRRAAGGEKAELHLIRVKLEGK